MDDVTRVKQISQYPFKSIASPADAFLLQTGGVGGPYQWTTPGGVLASMAGSSVGFGAPAPGDASPPQVFSQGFVVPAFGRFYVNAYSSTRGDVHYTQGPAAMLAFDAERWSWAVSLGPGATGQPVDWDVVAQLDRAGGLFLATTVTVGRDPIADNEVVTLALLRRRLELVVENSVLTWQGRTGNVRMFRQDIIDAGGAAANNARLTGRPTAPTPTALDQCDDQLATTQYVQQVAYLRIDDLLTGHPFVFTWNGRTGNVCLTLSDIEAEFFRPGNAPRAPTPGQSDYSDRIATTRWVTWNLDELHQTIGHEITAAGETVINYISNGYAPLHDAVLTGIPTAPTALPGTSSGQLATTAFVLQAVEQSTAGVVSFNNRSGIVSLLPTDVANVGGALLSSPAFTGTPTAPTAPVGTNSGQIATTAFVLAEVAAVSAGVTTWNGRSGNVTLMPGDIIAADGALLTSPQFTGLPAAPTAPAGTNTTQLATTAFVSAALGALSFGVTAFNGRTGGITLNSNDVSAAGGALVASPTFTGSPSGPTAAPGTSTTQLATTAFVQAALGGGGIVNSFNGRSGAVTLTPADVANASGAILLSAGTAPAGAANRMWWDLTGGQLYVWDVPNAAWVVAANTAIASDERIKNRVGEYLPGLEALAQIHPVRFTYKGNDQLHTLDARSGKTFVGVMAQEVEDVIPEMVSRSRGIIDRKIVEDLRNVDPTVLIYTLVNAVNELAGKVEQLKSEIAELRGEPAAPTPKPKKRSKGHEHD